MIFWANAGPIPGRASSWSAVALLMSTDPAAVEEVDFAWADPFDFVPVEAVDVPLGE